MRNSILHCILNLICGWILCELRIHLFDENFSPWIHHTIRRLCLNNPIYRIWFKKMGEINGRYDWLNPCSLTILMTVYKRSFFIKSKNWPTGQLSFLITFLIRKEVHLLHLKKNLHFIQFSKLQYYWIVFHHIL